MLRTRSATSCVLNLELPRPEAPGGPGGPGGPAIYFLTSSPEPKMMNLHDLINYYPLDCYNV